MEIMLVELGFKDCTFVGTPGTSIEGRTQDSFIAPLESADETRYRALVARANYLAPDRADIAFSVKELAKSMSKPTEGDWIRLKRLGRYLAGRPRMQLMFKWQNLPDTIRGYTDADWAGDKDSRKSTTGGCVVLGSHLLKGWAKTQSLIALSSAEGELYATFRAASETLGIMSMARDMGYKLKGQILGDANAALRIIHRKGARKDPTHRHELSMGSADCCRAKVVVLKHIGQGEPSRLVHEVSRQCDHGQACGELGMPIYWRTRQHRPTTTLDQQVMDGTRGPTGHAWDIQAGNDIHGNTAKDPRSAQSDTQGFPEVSTEV